MGRLFAFITQLRNLTCHQVRFCVPNWFHIVRDLASERTRNIKQHRIVRYCREYGPDWTIGILMDGEFTGIEIRSSDLLEYARLVFRYVRNEAGHDVLCVEGVKENQTSDYLLRLRETASPMRESEKHVEKSIYEVKENRHPVYSSIADENVSTLPMSAPSRLRPDSDICKQNSPEKMPTSNEPMYDTENNVKPNDSTFVPPPEELQCPRNEETTVPEIPNHGLNTGNITRSIVTSNMSVKKTIMTDVQDYKDGFVHGILFMLALMFVPFVRMSIS